MKYIKRRTVHLLLSSVLLSASASVADNAWGQTAPSKPSETVKADSPTEDGAIKRSEPPAVNADSAASTSKPADSKPDGDASTPLGPKQEGKPGDAGMPGTGSPPPTQAVVPAGPMKVDPTQIPQGPPGTPLKVQANLEIPQDPFIDSLFIVFNYVSVGAMGGALVFGVLWFLKHNKRKQMIAAGLISEEEDDDDDDEDDDEPVLVKTAAASSTESEVETSAPAAVTPVPVEETKISSDLTSAVESSSKTNASSVSSETASASEQKSDAGNSSAANAVASSDETSVSSSDADGSVSADKSEAPAAVTASGGAAPGSSKSGKGKKNRKKKS